MKCVLGAGVEVHIPDLEETRGILRCGRIFRIRC